MEIKVLLDHLPIRKSSLVFGSSHKIIFIFHQSVWTYLYDYIFLSPPYFSFGSISIYITWWFMLYAPTLPLVLPYGRYFFLCFVSLCCGLRLCSLRLCAFSFVDCCSVFWCKDECFGSFIIITIIGRCRYGDGYLMEALKKKIEGLFDRYLHTINMKILAKVAISTMKIKLVKFLIRESGNHLG